MKTFIIAEAGVNHNGSLKNAKALIDIAVEAGCDAVKFQAFKTESLVTKTASKAQYQIENTDNDETQYKMLKKLELYKEDYVQLMDYCKKRNILFLATPFDEESVNLLEELGIEMYKVSSGDLTNKTLLKYIAQKKKPIILSTGMATLEEVKEAIQWITEEGHIGLTLLHCTSDYPTEPKDVNLLAMITMKQAFKLNVGYSDHTLGIDVPIAAVALGATMIEKHFTLDKNMDGPDHKASLEPYELKELVQAVRNIEAAMGNGIKNPTPNELKIKDQVRKSIVAKTQIDKGQIITLDRIAIKRPAGGIEPKNINILIGRKAARDIKEDELITLGDIDLS